MSINSGDDIQFSSDSNFEESVLPFEEIPEVANVEKTEDGFQTLRTYSLKRKTVAFRWT